MSAAPPQGPRGAANPVRRLLELAEVLERGGATYLVHVGFDAAGAVRRVRVTLASGEPLLFVMQAGDIITRGLSHHQLELGDLGGMPGPIGEVARAALKVAADADPIVRHAHQLAEARLHREVGHG